MHTVYFGHGLYGAVRFFRVRHGDVFVSAVVVVVTECETVFILYSGREFEVVYERRFYVRASYRYVHRREKVGGRIDVFLVQRDRIPVHAVRFHAQSERVVEILYR